MAKYEALVEIETLAILRENCREEPWCWYSNGQSCIARNREPTGNGLVLERPWSPSPRWINEEEK